MCLDSHLSSIRRSQAEPNAFRKNFRKFHQAASTEENELNAIDNIDMSLLSITKTKINTQ